MDKHNDSIRAAVARGCIARMEAIGVKGKRRDDEALSYLAGAMVGEMAGRGDTEQSTSPLSGMVFLAAVRGYADVVEFVAKLDAEAGEPMNTQPASHQPDRAAEQVAETEATEEEAGR